MADARTADGAQSGGARMRRRRTESVRDELTPAGDRALIADAAADTLVW